MLEVVEDLRKGEGFLPSNCIRTNRIMCLNGSWYFLTRESATPLGPFPNKAEVVKAAEDYIAFAAVADDEMISRCYEHLAKVG